MPLEKANPQITEQSKAWITSENQAKTPNFELSNKLNQINNILQILDLSDDQEWSFRTILERQNAYILQNLVRDSKQNIVTFLLSTGKEEVKSEKQATVKVQAEETQKQNTETEKNNKKFERIKSLFTNQILDKNPDIADKFKKLENANTPQEKNKILKEILQILKTPGKLKSIIDELGWADKNNPKYTEFKNALLGIDSSFESYFEDLEKLNSGSKLPTDEIIQWIEKDSWGILNINLKTNPPLSKISLLWSAYSFDKEVNQQALDELMTNSTNELNEVQNSFTVLKGLYKPFDSLLIEIRKSWGKENLKDQLQANINKFPKEIFDDLDETYKTMDIKPDDQLKASDILNLANISTPDDLRLHIELIKEKLLKIKTAIQDKQAQILTHYQTDLKKLVTLKSKEKEKQLEVLEFMKACGFDLMPQEITDKIIGEIKSNMLSIPWLELNIRNIDLKNWHFGESLFFADQERGLNSASKTNMVKFVNKIICWDISKPLPVETITNWFMMADVSFLQNEFLEAGIVSNTGWRYGKIADNLKTTAISK